ncbi:MAG: hypothetical protein WCW13_05900 [archaeon]|jgi:hypothetical protein
MNCSKYLAGFVFLVFVGTVFASCEFDNNTIQLAQINYLLKEDSSADVTMMFGVNYPKDCLLAEFVNVEMNNSTQNNQVSVGYIDIVSDEVPCPVKFQELILASFPGLSNGLNCYGKYFVDKNYLQMSLYGSTTKLSQDKDKNFIFEIGGIEIISKLGKNSFLNITLPQNSTLYSFTPTNPTFMTPIILTWSPFPNEKTIINYKPFDFQKEAFDRVFPVLLIISILYLFIAAISIYFMRIGISSAEKVDLTKRLAELRDKMKLLETSYLRRQIDEITYRRLTEQYQFQINEINAQIVKSIKKVALPETAKLNNNSQVSNTVENNQKPSINETK